MTRNGLKLSLALALGVMATPVLAQDWFLHKFGELRAFHGDWLAVCQDNGDGPCRAVQTSKDAGSAAFFDARVAVHRIDFTPHWAVEIMDRGMPEAELERVWFDFDGEIVEVPAGNWVPGDLSFPNVAETITISNPDIANDLVARMKAGRKVVVHYSPAGNGNGQSVYSLRGITAATNAINAHTAGRQ